MTNIAPSYGTVTKIRPVSDQFICRGQLNLVQP